MIKLYEYLKEAYIERLEIEDYMIGAKLKTKEGRKKNEYTN